MQPAGILLHQAIEMLLKSHLRMTISSEKLKTKEMGHNLSALWDHFKEAVPDESLPEFDSLVAQLNSWHQYLRYPDSYKQLGTIKGLVLTLYVHRPKTEPRATIGKLSISTSKTSTLSLRPMWM